MDLLWIEADGDAPYCVDFLSCAAPGVFGNDPMMVAKLLRDYLEPGGMFERRFGYVLFAVFDTSNDGQRYRAFSRVVSTS